MKNESKPNKKYKDSLFTRLFSDKQSIIELYNAVKGTSYPLDAPVDIITLEDVFYMNKKNDLCFTIDNKFVILVEHQSTINQNMPLRFLIYVAREYEKLIDSKSIYKELLMKIPTPEFIVLYNGEKEVKEPVLQLSDAFAVQQEEAALNLKVQVLNIKYDSNIELVKKCEKLKGYSYVVYLIEKYKKENNTLQEAIQKAIAQCLQEGILTDFLQSNASEVFNMLFTEFDIDEAKEVWKEEGIEMGQKAGRQEGIAALISACNELGISYDKTLQKVMEKYKLSEKEAKEKMQEHWAK